VNVTPWFPASVKPARPGVYERLTSWRDNVFALWNGEHWLMYTPTPETASRQTSKSAHQDFAWRGIVGPDVPTHDELVAALRKLKEAVDLLAQPMRLDGLVNKDSPGGQLTAYLLDGTPVCRDKHRAKVMAEVNALLARLPKDLR
jgi:hypothetical protein